MKGCGRGRPRSGDAKLELGGPSESNFLPILFISLILPILFPTRKTNIRKTSLRYLAFTSECYM